MAVIRKLRCNDKSGIIIWPYNIIELIALTSSHKKYKIITMLGETQKRRNALIRI